MLTYTSHLDLARAWERALRRARLPLAYSGGFNPRPKLQLAAALPLGHTGGAELLDVWLEEPLPVENFARALAPVLPDGLLVSQIRQVVLKEPSLPAQVVAAEYRVTVEGWGEPAEAVQARIEQVMAATELAHERRGRQYDLRPLIRPPRGGVGGAGNGGGVRPPSPATVAAENRCIGR
jgi:radical SAM-linked protein